MSRLRCFLIGLFLQALVGCASRMSVLSTPQPVIVNGKSHTVIAVVTNTPIGSNFTDVFLFDSDGKLENASCSSNGGLMEGSLPTAMAAGLNSAISAAISGGILK